MDTARAPQFIIIGAVKAATTWTAHQLRQHPSIFIPGPEPHFFSTEHHRGLDWYERLFAAAPAGSLIGEKSADYLSHPEAAGRIAKALPNANLIVQLRNPIERAYSDYCMLLRRGAVGPNPAHYFKGPNPQSARFLGWGLYAQHLARYFDHFPQEQIRVVLYDEIKTQPNAVLTSICQHINVDIRINSNEVGNRKNDSETPTLPLSLRLALRPFQGVVKPLRNRPWFKAIHGALARPIKYPPLTPDLRGYLRDYYLPDVQQLQRMIGRDLTSWLAADAPATNRAEGIFAA